MDIANFVNKPEKIREIEQVLLAEFNQMCNLLPAELSEPFRNHAYIAGGCIYSLYNDLVVHDYDFFLDDFNILEQILHYFEASEFTVRYGNNIFITENAITIGKHQIIVKYFGKPADVLGHFDFHHNMFAFVDNRIIAYDHWYYLDSNDLSFNQGRARDLLGVLFRVPKFVKRGMDINVTEAKKIILSLHDDDIDEEDIKVFKKYKSY